MLAGVAALALFAASGIASAQQTQQDQKGGAAQSSMHSQRSQQGAKNQTANQGMKNQGAQQSKNQTAMSRRSSGQNAQNESKMQSGERNAGKMSNAGKSDKSRSAQAQKQNGEKSFNRSAQEQRQNKGATNRPAQGQQKQLNAQSRTTQSKNGQFATKQSNKTQRGTSTAQRNEQLKGLQGSTRAPMQGATTERRNGGSANVSLNDQQRTKIRETVINSRSAPRVSNVDFSVNVGTVVPRGHIHLVRVPETLIRIQPRWRHYVYFVYNDEIVIVDPRSMRIIDVMPV
ncbi:MAG: DUF1236 domain-containing protein [Xanthobacteraceae bacterium]